MSDEPTSEAPSHHLSEADELWREATVMALYISIVLLAAIVSLPASFGTESDKGLGTLLLTIWGTTIGLALAHWFAFNVAAVGFRGGRILRHDISEAGAQLGGAATVAVVTTVPVLFVHGDYLVYAVVLGPAAVLGVAGYRVARWSDRSKLHAFLAGVIVLALGLGIAILKSSLAGH